MSVSKRRRMSAAANSVDTPTKTEHHSVDAPKSNNRKSLMKTPLTPKVGVTSLKPTNQAQPKGTPGAETSAEAYVTTPRPANQVQPKARPAAKP